MLAARATWGRRGLLALALVAVLSWGGVATPVAEAHQSPIGENWTVYHGDPEGHGMASPIDLAHPHRVWTSPALDGQLFGEPLVFDRTVVVATERDTVYSLDADNGRIRWSTHLGTPVASATLPCGDIAPTVGVTSTPVIDPTRGEIFVVADLATSDGPVHQLVGLRTTNGSIELRESVDPPGTDPAAMLQRVGLTLDQGRVVFGFGGNEGDCSNYHGWVVGVPENGGALVSYEIDSRPGERQGAVWMGGAAPLVQPNGDLWFAVGNGSAVSTSAHYDGSDSVVELSAQFQKLQFFAPADWASDNAHDRDLGSGAPALLADGLIFQAGKSQTSYLLSASHLGGIGGQLTSLGRFCGGNVDGGAAVVGPMVYVPCQAGVEAVSVQSNPPSLRVRWQGAGAGPPIVADRMVWSIGTDGVLYGLNERTGTTAQRLQVGAEANHFPTPSVGDGLLLVAGLNRVEAFTG